jgi:hypothetical protein
MIVAMMAKGEQGSGAAAIAAWCLITVLLSLLACTSEENSEKRALPDGSLYATDSGTDAPAIDSEVGVKDAGNDADASTPYFLPDGCVDPDAEFDSAIDDPALTQKQKVAVAKCRRDCDAVFCKGSTVWLSVCDAWQIRIERTDQPCQFKLDVTGDEFGIVPSDACNCQVVLNSDRIVCEADGWQLVDFNFIRFSGAACTKYLGNPFSTGSVTCPPCAVFVK